MSKLYSLVCQLPPLTCPAVTDTITVMAAHTDVRTSTSQPTRAAPQMQMQASRPVPTKPPTVLALTRPPTKPPTKLVQATRKQGKNTTSEATFNEVTLLEY
jgi:hypothetical protein